MSSNDPELTARAVVAGMVIGGVLCLSNVYVVLKTGWSLGVTLTSSILAFALFRALRAVGLVKRPFSVLENVMMASVASTAGFMTGGGNMAALPALFLVTGARPGGAGMVLWFALLATLGVLVAIPIKRRIIDEEKLPFPSSVATAEALRSMHREGADAGRARSLAIAGVASAVFTFVRDARVAWLPLRPPAQLTLPFELAGHSLKSWSLAIDASGVLLGGGMLMGPRTAWSMALGAVLAYGVLAPQLVARGVIAAVEYKQLVQLTLWPGAAMLVASGLVSLAFEGRAIVAAIATLKSAVRAPTSGSDEAPAWWFVVGLAVLAPITVFAMQLLFGIPWWMGAISLPLALVLAVVAARVTGETDITPTKALGPATQLFYGAVLPGNVTANIMGANVTGGIGLHASDVLSDLKTGWVLGASPRKQVLAQLFGVLAGAVIVVPAFELLVPTADLLGSERFPAPAVQVWASVSKVLAGGLAGLSAEARTLVVVGLVVGAALTIAERLSPAKVRALVPSPMGLGIAMVMPGSSSLTMCTGALVAIVLRRMARLDRDALVPAASGMIAGESLTGITMAMVRALVG
ncbi:OPT/YSL family transporter [Myxococcota bacterium]|nr:OPT/YSL family transporter [Myxococcota bacterium]